MIRRRSLGFIRSRWFIVVGALIVTVVLAGAILYHRDDLVQSAALSSLAVWVFAIDRLLRDYLRSRR